MVRLILIVAFAVIQAAVGIPEILTTGGYWDRALLYSFFHANWRHLAVNSVAIWSIYRPGRCKACRDFVIPYIIAIAVYPLSFRPVIGFSNILYAVLGLRTPPLSSPWWRQPVVWVFLAVTVAMVFIPRFSATTHVAAFLLGMGGAAVGRWWQGIKSDAGRYL
jgi:membrane associated rhomboid family serine protease